MAVLSASLSSEGAGSPPPRNAADPDEGAAPYGSAVRVQGLANQVAANVARL